MGGAVSSGRDNTELIDNLMGGNYIRSRDVERVFRALDRGDYMTPDARDQAYKDLAWRNGPLHMSAPCIYSEVMEGLELKPGLSFLNVGSGTGYLSTLVGLIIGASGINHGVEIHPIVVEYAIKKLSQFMESSPTLDEFDFCEPKFVCGNGLCLAPLQAPYDRVYCGAGCPEEYQNYFQQLIKVGGILIMPLNDNLLQVKRTGPSEWQTRSLLNVSFASLRMPTKEESADLIRLEEQTPVRLQALARSVIRTCMRGAMRRRHPVVREPPARAPPAKRACPRRICIPVDDDDSDDALNGLHDLDRASGAHEMNALLSLVLSMGHNRVAGALRVAPLDSDSSSAGGDPEPRISPTMHIRHEVDEDSEGNETPGGRNVLMFEFRDSNRVLRHSNPPIPIRRPRLRRRPLNDTDDDTDGDDWGADTHDIGMYRANRGRDRDDVETDRSDVGTDRDDREANREETEHSDKERNNASGDNEAPKAKEPESESEKVEVAIENKEAKSNDIKGMEDVPLAAKEVDSKVKASTPKDKDVPKKARKGILKKTFKEKEVKNPLKDRNFKLAEIPLDDIDKDNVSGDDSISEYKPSTSREEFADKTAEEKQLLDHTKKTEQEKELLDHIKKSEREKEFSDHDDKTANDIEHKLEQEKEFSDHTDQSPRETIYVDQAELIAARRKYTDKTEREKEVLDFSDFSEKEARLKRSFRKAREAKKSKSRHRSRSSRHSTDNDEDQRNPEVPAEVEICLGKEMAGPSTMEWETSEPIDAEAKERSSGDDVTETESSKVKEEKRHKLDSGIGEENSPSGGSASHNSAESEDSDTTEEDEGCDEDVKGRRRRQKRGHLSTRSSSSADEEPPRRAAGPRAPRAPRAARAPRRDTDSSRRAQLSLFMKRGVKELPLPHALKKYVNLNRCFEF